ncbi:MAG: DUF357 domain-containing protein [Methanosarcinales archaeon Met12]|nr:MAG: DUF357 domain-containing protein [Methanosarcinales archaeon Met12]
MAAELEEKVHRYKELLERALGDVEIKSPEHLQKVAEYYLTMARSYYEDGIHFQEKNDLVNALACFSYGHAWLDAGVRLEVFVVGNKALFTV